MWFWQISTHARQPTKYLQDERIFKAPQDAKSCLQSPIGISRKCIRILPTPQWAVTEISTRSAPFKQDVERTFDAYSDTSNAQNSTSLANPDLHVHLPVTLHQGARRWRCLPTHCCFKRWRCRVLGGSKMLSTTELRQPQGFEFGFGLDSSSDPVN